MPFSTTRLAVSTRVGGGCIGKIGAAGLVDGGLKTFCIGSLIKHYLSTGNHLVS